MAKVLDYSAGFPGAANIKRAGYAGAVRYIGFPDRTKCTTAAELRDYTAHGLGMALVYQNAWRDFDGAHAAGVEAAARARRHADDIGFPAGRPIYFAIDTDVVTAADFDKVERYLRGAGSVLGGADLVGVYGEHDVTVHARRKGVASWFWQTRAWSGTPVQLDPERHLYQQVGYVYVNGIACDANDVLKPDWGQHTEDDMPSAEEIADAVHKRLMNHKYPVWVKPQQDSRDEMPFWQHVQQARGFAVLAMKAARNDMSEAELREAIRAVVGPVVRDAVKAALDADNVAQADAIVDEIQRRLVKGDAA